MISRLRAFLELMKKLDDELTFTIHVRQEKPRVTVTRKRKK